MPLPVAILVVDEAAESLAALQALVDGDGVRCFTARSDKEAFTALRENDVALAIVAVDGSGLDGLALAEAMRATDRTHTVPIVFVTAGHGEPPRGFPGYEAGPVDHASRPIDPRILRSKVDTYVALHRQRRDLAAQLARLDEMGRVRDIFVAALGHDLRSPLQSVELGAQVILAKPDDAAVAVRMATTMQRASRRMARLIEQLLDFARARAAGGIAVTPAASDLTEVARAVVAELDPPVTGRVELRVDGDTQGTWDRDRLAQVVSSLLGNAVRHGEPDAPIVVAVSGTADAVTITVANRGAIPAAMLPTLFDPFARGDDGHARATAGLGLYLVDQIVRAHGGRVAVESTPEHGTTFRVELPRHSAVTAPSRA